MIFRPETQGKQTTAVIDNKVGGYFGINMTPSRTEFVAQSNIYAPGEQIPIVINANNTMCSASVKSFKFKLWRHSTFMFQGEEIQTYEYLTSIKIPGCKAKEAIRREYSIPLPMVEQDGKTLLAGSTQNSTFSVSYFLRCFVKHVSVFEIGQGHCIQIPIQILH